MKTLHISEETYEKIKDQIRGEDCTLDSYEDMIGKKFFFRSVTYHQLGRVVKIVGSFAQLECASWVADSGRFMQAIKDGTLKEVEPVGDMFVNLNGVVDFFPWKHDLPTKQK